MEVTRFVVVEMLEVVEVRSPLLSADLLFWILMQLFPLMAVRVLLIMMDLVPVAQVGQFGSMLPP